MAGRGTDIILGGNPEFEAKRELKRRGYADEAISFATSFVPSEDPELLAVREEFGELLKQYKEERAPEQEKVKELGGLSIIGSERHESRRIDNQLRGRAGRQGDPGRTQFFISLEDELMRLFGGERMQAIVSKLGVSEDEPIEAGMLTKSIENAQKKVEGRNFGIRKYVLQYDNVMNKQREVIYSERHKVLFGEDLRDNIMSMMGELVDEIVEPVTVASKYAEEWDFEILNANLKKIWAQFPGVEYTEDEKTALSEEDLKESIKGTLEEMYKAKEEEIGAERMRELERMILIRVVDNKWMDHIDNMDQLKNGIGLRGLGGQDPAAAYAQEGFDMFELMIQSIKEDTVKFCYNVTFKTNTERRQVMGTGEGRKADYVDEETSMSGNGAIGVMNTSEGSVPSAAKVPEREQKPETYRRTEAKVGRNDPCPCGSGKKYKNCCGRNL